MEWPPDEVLRQTERLTGKGNHESRQIESGPDSADQSTAILFIAAVPE